MLSSRKEILEAWKIRNAEPTDFAFVTSVIDDWWGGREMRAMLPKLFFEHFRETSFVAVERDAQTEMEQLVGFLNGFFSQSFPTQAYIHFVGVHPDYRKSGLGRQLYEKFFEVARSHGRTEVHCVTAPVNKTSIAFHKRMGFEIVPGDAEVDGTPVHLNYDGAGEARVLFVKRL